MLSTLKTLGLAASLAGFAALPAQAMPFSVSATATVVTSTGSYAGDLVGGTLLQVDIALSTAETDASNAITTPSVVPGHEFTSFYEFATTDGFSWAGDLVPASGDGFNADIMGIVVNNDLPLTSADTGGLLPSGTYDWIELLGSTTGDVCLLPGGICAPDEFSPADGEEWTLAFFGDSSWFTDGSVIPDALPADLTALLVGIEFDEFGEEVGFVFATVGDFTTDLPRLPATEIPAPAGVGFLAFFAVAAAWKRRRR
ncbi:MAG: hypothetical protein ACI9JL_004539 [Paracoccaceae bacterium]|jgi:hypothetical protein